MRSLWFYLFPLLFLPNLGASRATHFGTLEISDYLVFPYLLLVVYGMPKRSGLLIHHLLPFLVAFGAWVSIGTLSIPVRYPGESSYYLFFGLLKFAKLILYVTAGVLTAKRLSEPGVLWRFHWALLAAGCVVAAALLKMAGQEQIPSAGGPIEGFKANNGVSVMLSVIACYIAGAVVMRAGTRAWRRCAWVALGGMVLGSAFSNGRSGWLAAAVAMLYLLCRSDFSRQVVVTLVLGTALLVPTYYFSETFRKQVDKTLSPNPRYLRRYQAGAMGVDDGGRLHNWAASATRFQEAPLWGAGFFHRGGQSPLWFSGSHNFFLQMFLETGLVGGILILMIFWQMWRHAGTPVSRLAKLEIPLKCALVAAFVGGLGGEYFYGGPAVLALIAVYGPVGSLATRRAPQPRTAPFWTGAPALYPRLGAPRQAH